MACALGIEQDCNECRMCGNGKGSKKMTNADRIRSMTDEELAEFLTKKFCHGIGENLIKEWLESECDANC